jgi:hypothetical protein
VSQLTSPGMVDARSIRQKLSKQLKIDLEAHEYVHLCPEPVVFSQLTDERIQEIVHAPYGEDTTPLSSRCTVQLRSLGEYLARISLAGGHVVPLRFEIVEKHY